MPKCDKPWCLVMAASLIIRCYWKIFPVTWHIYIYQAYIHVQYVQPVRVLNLHSVAKFVSLPFICSGRVPIKTGFCERSSET
jgi:hypothetical protein